MNLVILKTDIKTKQKVKQVKPLLDSHPIIEDWSIDTSDIDNVLRIVASVELRETDVISWMKKNGYQCESLPD